MLNCRPLKHSYVNKATLLTTLEVICKVFFLFVCKKERRKLTKLEEPYQELSNDFENVN